jgi:hypothetical protein
VCHARDYILVILRVFIRVLHRLRRFARLYWRSRQIWHVNVSTLRLTDLHDCGSGILSIRRVLRSDTSETRPIVLF